MTKDKMRKIISACVSAGTVFLTCLSIFIACQWVTIAVLDHKIKKAEAEVAYWTEQLEKAETEEEYYTSDFYLKQAYAKLQMLENKQ